MKAIKGETSVVRALAAIGFAAFLGVTTPASATVTVSVFDGITLATCADGAACDVNPVGGIVTFVYVVGSWAGSVATGASTSPVPLIDLHGFATSTGAGSLSLFVSDIDFTLGPTASLRNFIGGIGGTQPASGASISYSMWADDANALFGTIDLIDSGAKAGTPFSDVLAGTGTTADTFSMTLGVVVTHNATGFSSFDFEGSAAPEPGTLLLVGAGLLGFVGLGRRKAG